MLSCKKLIENGSEYLEGDLSRWERFKYKFHLFMCKSCSRYILQLKQVISMISLSPKKKIPQDMEDMLTKEFEESMKK
ncbi:zf-HC2 domain-containing protein [Kangiella sp. HZ709]|uniref:zf-HC2 domain-containing protein n=1 Tax=Kangiella sp. HZ709 TaxID=2666328 RepID=UPI0012B09E18|nr:zf-HC2 domain-containing protein [Kangiella sp. HZ709]MRX27817.1 hypothetical protein [Kangiella sp. HZ709]